MKAKVSRGINVAVCGSNAAGHPEKINAKARRIGELVAEAGGTLFSGVTTGFSYEAVKGASEVGGRIIGVTGAESRKEHEERYEKVDLDLWTNIIYSGVGYKMRDVIMIRSVDAAIFIGGGVGTLLEMSAAVDYDVVLGVLDGSGGAAGLYRELERISHRNKPEFIVEKDPQLLVESIIEKLEASHG